jgi:integrase
VATGPAWRPTVATSRFRPGLHYKSHAIGLDGNELGALPLAVGLGPPAEHTLICLPALNGVRVSEACGATTEALAVERGHRTLTGRWKGGKRVTVPIAPWTARAVDLAVGEWMRVQSSSPVTDGVWTGTALVASSGGSPGGRGSPSRPVLTPSATRSSPLPSVPVCHGACSRSGQPRRSAPDHAI